MLFAIGICAPVGTVPMVFVLTFIAVEAPAQLYDKDCDPFIKANPEELEEIRKECAETIPLAIKGIYEFWKARRVVGGQAVGSRKKVGRNDPCPCGSGRKYKRCCGAN